MRLRVAGALVVVCVVSSVAAGCGGSSSSSSSTKSFTVKVDYEGKTAYIVVSVPAAHETAIRDAYIAKAGKATPLNVNLTEQSPQGPLNCSQSAKIGQHHPHSVPPGMRPYIGEPVTVKVYGSGLVADALCHSLQHQGL